MRRRFDGRAAMSTDDLAQWYDRHAAGLYRYAVVVLADAAAAEDVVQQVFTKLADSAPALDTPERYLRRAVRNECYSRLAARAAAPSPAGDTRALLEAAPDAAVQPDPADRLTVEAALRELPAEQREVVLMKVYEGMTFEEIAAETGVPLNTAASRYRYALDKLRRQLSAPVRKQS
jgi:RNA polymerase sigma-70 factor (ECF subfamily)